MDDAWVCGSCKSINRARERRCYKCHGERDQDDIGGGSERRTIEAVASRTVRDYLPTWPLAILAGGLLVAVAVLGVLLLIRGAQDFPAMRDAFVAAINSGVEPDAGFLAQSAETAFLGLLRTGLVLLALVSFASWLALATLNVPSLGGGVPSRSPVRVFVYTLIPVWNLFKVPGMVQDVLYRLDPAAGGAWMVMAATIGLLGSWFLSFIGGMVITAAGVGDMLAASSSDEMVRVFAAMMDQSFWLSVVTELMITVGTLLVVALMIRVEQRCAARNREVHGALAALSPAVAPAQAPAPAQVPAPAPVPAARATSGIEVPGAGPPPAVARRPDGTIPSTRLPPPPPPPPQS